MLTVLAVAVKNAAGGVAASPSAAITINMPAPPAPPPGTTVGPSTFAMTLVPMPLSAPTDVAGAGAASVAGASPQTAARGLMRLTGVSVFSNPPKSSTGGAGIHSLAPTLAPTAIPPTYHLELQLEPQTLLALPTLRVRPRLPHLWP